MAYPVFTSVTRTALQTSGTTYAVTLPSGIVAGDLVMVKLAQDGASASLGVAASGFTAIGTQAVSGASSSLWFYLVAAGGETSATFDCANAGIVGTSFIVKDAHATPIGASSGADFVRTDWNNVASAASGSLTTGATQGDECLLLYSFNMDGSNQYSRCELADMVCLDKLASNSASQASYIIGYRQQQAQGAAPTVTMHNISATEGGNGWVIAIRNKSGGALAPDLRPDIAELQWHGSWNATHDGTPTWQAPSSFAASINGITCSTTAPTVSTTNSQAQTPWGVSSGLSATESTAACWAGGTFAHASTDMTGKVFGFQFSLAAISASANYGTDGVIVGFSDGTYWVTYQVISRAKTWLSSDEMAAFIAVGNATEYANSEGTSSSSIDWSAITRRLYAVNRATTTASNLWVKNATLFGKTALTGGGELRPSNFNDYNTLLNSWGAWKWSELQGSAQVKPKSSVQIGDGTNATYFDGATNSIGFPQAWSATDNGNWQMDWNVDTSQIGLFVKAKDGDTIKLAAGAATAGNLQLLTVDAASSTHASTAYDFAQAFGGFSPTWKTGVACSNAIITGCGQVAFKGVDVVSTQIKNSLAGTTAAVVGFDANGGSMTGCTTSATTATGYHVELGASVTDFTLTDHTFTGSALTDKVHVLAATGTVTITISGTTALVAGDVTTDGATVVIAAPELYQSVAITGLATTYRLQIFDIEYDLTVSGITVTPTAGATYAHNGITWTVRSASITAGAGTITVYGTGTPAASGTLTKTGGTGDASVAFSAYAVGGTELYIGVPAATYYTWTDSVAAAAPRVIRVRVMEDGPSTGDAIEMIDAIVGMCGITEGTESVGYLVAAVADDVYNDRGVDGSTITGITIDDTTLRLEIASGTIVNYNGTDVLVIDGRDIYAYETYWLGTTAGMRDEARFIEAIDAVNFRCSSFKLLGTSGYPIMIRNCYMVDAATGIFASLVDYSGDPISNAPDHMAAIVVSTSDSVVTGTLAEFIAAVPTAATNASATRTELTSELTRVTKLAALSGIDATLVVTPTSREAGSVSQTITTVGDTTTVESA